MSKLKITTTNAPEESVNRLYEVLKMGRAGAIPVEMDGEVKSAIIMVKDDLTKLDMLHFAQLADADTSGNALIYPIHIREAIGKMIDPWTEIWLWKQTSDRSREVIWHGPAKDLPKEYREVRIKEFLPSKPATPGVHLAIILEA